MHTRADEVYDQAADQAPAPAVPAQRHPDPRSEVYRLDAETRARFAPTAQTGPAVSRQREHLADASAVQFTRNPLGLAGAPALLIGADMLGRFREVTLDFAANRVSFEGLRRQTTRTIEDELNA